MIRSLTIENYRGFRKFELHDLGRVNLIVGTNNAGKTSVLEAIHILESPGEIAPIWAIQTRRGEDFELSEANRIFRQVDIRQLFYGHQINIGNQLSIQQSGDNSQVKFNASIVEWTANGKQSQEDVETNNLFDDTESDPISASLLLKWISPATTNPIGSLCKLTRQGGLSSNQMRMNTGSGHDNFPIHYVSSGSLSADTVISFFEDVVLTVHHQKEYAAHHEIDRTTEV